MKVFLFTIALLAMAVGVYAADDQAYLAILAETKLQKMPGMPKLPPGIKIPGMPALGKPERVLNIRLWSPGIAPADASASIVPPEGLKQGKKLVLDIYRPKPDQTEAVAPGDMPKESDPDNIKDFTIKIYWGSSEKVKEGQPKIISWANIPAEQKQAMRKQSKEMQDKAKASIYFYKPNWTTGFWPTSKQPGKITDDASLVGNYALTTSYTGNIAIEAPSNVNFMDPIDIVTPNLDKKVDLEKALFFEWKPIANALGLHASIMGMEGKNTLIIWSSSEKYSELVMSDMGFMQMADVKARVKDTIFMKGEQSKVIVPEGIFKNCSFTNFTMSGYGPGAALAEGQPLPRIQTKTTFNAMLSMKGMGMPEGMDKIPDMEENTDQDSGTDSSSDTEDGGAPPPPPSLDGQ